MRKSMILIVLFVTAAGLVFSQSPSASELLRKVDDNEIFKTIEYEGEMIIEYQGRRYVKVM